MPFEMRKDNQTWGPHVAAVVLNSGDEVPAPVKKVLIQNGTVATVDKVSGKRWADQPEASQKAWAECNGMSFLTVTKKADKSVSVVAVNPHASRMVENEEQAPPATPRRRRDIPKVEAPEPAPSELQEVAGAESVSTDEAPAPPHDVEGTGLLEDKKPKPKKRGRKKKTSRG